MQVISATNTKFNKVVMNLKGECTTSGPAEAVFLLELTSTASLQYAKFVKPSFEEFILPSKKHADVIIPRGADNDVAIDLIVQHIRTKLGQHDLCKIYPNVFVINSTFQVYFYLRFESCN